MLSYYIVKLFSKLMCIAPKFIRNLVAKFLGGVAVVAVPEWRMQMAKTNIMECLGVDEVRAAQIAEASLRRFGRMIIEVMRFPLLKPENIEQTVNVEGLEYLDAAYKQNKGVIMATGHYGNWELLGATVALHGYPMLSITRKQNNGAMDKFINEYRQLVGQKVAYNRGESGLLAISRMLKEKHLLGVLYDQDTNDDGVEINLFGKNLLFQWELPHYQEFTVLLYCLFFCIIMMTELVRRKYIRRFIRLKLRTKRQIFMKLPARWLLF